MSFDGDGDRGDLESRARRLINASGAVKLYMSRLPGDDVEDSLEYTRAVPAKMKTGEEKRATAAAKVKAAKAGEAI